MRDGELTIHVVVHAGGGARRGVRAVRLDGQPIGRARVELGGAGQRELEIWLGAEKLGSDVDSAAAPQDRAP